jgi:hypothetical protein
VGVDNVDLLGFWRRFFGGMDLKRRVLELRGEQATTNAEDAEGAEGR